MGRSFLAAFCACENQNSADSHGQPAMGMLPWEGGDMGEFEMADRLHCCCSVERADLDEPVVVVEVLTVRPAGCRDGGANRTTNLGHMV